VVVVCGSRCAIVGPTTDIDGKTGPVQTPFRAKQPGAGAGITAWNLPALPFGKAKLNCDKMKVLPKFPATQTCAELAGSPQFKLIQDESSGTVSTP
jgi:hypothetical protein